MSKITLDNLSDNLKAYLEGLGLSEEQVLNLINENGLDEEELKAMLKDTMSINELSTNSKTVIGAINELFQSANNGKELIASAIGEPLSSEDTFSAMSNDINSLLATFKTNMMNNGITVESGDKFKSLIDKVKTMVENGQGKGIQFAEGSLSKTHSAYGTSQGSPVTTTVDYDPGFVPTILLVKISIVSGTDTPIQYYTPNIWCSNTVSSANIHIRNTSKAIAVKITDLAITDDKSFIMSWTPYSATTQMQFLEYIAIGVGEEDTTLRDSLASILQEEGVSVTEEDDIASLITKVNEEFDDKENEISSLNTNITLLTNQVNSLTNELAGKVTPAGTAVAGDVLSGKTFINSTGQTITGTMVNRGGAQTVTPGTSNKTLNAGYYSGNITVAGDADLVAANIVSGKNIFGVAGTATASSLGGRRYASGSTMSGSRYDNSYFAVNCGFQPSVVCLEWYHYTFGYVSILGSMTIKGSGTNISATITVNSTGFSASSTNDSLEQCGVTWYAWE